MQIKTNLATLYLFIAIPITLFGQIPYWETSSPITPWQSLGSTQVERWNILEITLEGPKKGNPYQEVQLDAFVIYYQDTTFIRGFYDGTGKYKLRFMPSAIGEYQFITHSNVDALNNKSGRFTCYHASPGNNGPVLPDDVNQFVYANGTPFYPLSTTAFAWIHQPIEKQEETLVTLSESPFNRIRMTLFPMDYIYTTNEPTIYPFPRNRKGYNELSRFNYHFFQQLEKRITHLMNLGIEADIILFHPWDRWGYSEMDKATDDYYLRYVMARLSAFRNVWWTVAVDYDVMDRKHLDDWDRFFEIIYENDPYSHLRTIHSQQKLYDYTKPWVTHCSIQGSGISSLPEWVNRFQKPILLEEQAYEGNLIPNWGRFSAEEIVRRSWIAALSGAYLTHGETIKDPMHEWIWWAKGGVLLGASPQRLELLKKVLQDAPRHQWQPISKDCGGVEGEYYLYYFGENKPQHHSFNLPGYREYQVDVIDTWNMTIEPRGRFGESFELDLPGKPYIAVRIRRMDLLFPAEPVEILYNGQLFFRQAVVQLRHPRFQDIYYTLDGSIPTNAAQRYVAPIVIGADSTLLRVVAYDTTGRQTKLNSRLFLQVSPLPGVKLSSERNGLGYRYYLGLFDSLPDFDDLKPQSEGLAKEISLSYAEQVDAYALVFEGFIKIPISDIYTFTLLSDDGSRLYIGNSLVVDNDGQHAARRVSGQIGLAAGFHPLRIEYFEAGGGETLSIFWANSTDREESLKSKSIYIVK
ncbi:MAG: DUF5060 domain-containing protein [Calditrichaeota bacterium]|nr:MAG: DUF5060 domain-containing protein [Calditrichota bacterium]